VPTATRWLSIAAWRQRRRQWRLLSHELELALPQIVLEVGAGPGGRPLPGKRRAAVAVDRLLAKVELHRGASRSRRPGRSCLSRHVIACIASALRHPRACSFFVFVVVAALVAVTVARVVATCGRAALTRIENALRASFRAESRALPPRPRRLYVPGIYSESPIRSHVLSRSLSFSLSLSLSFSPSLSDHPLRVGNLGSSHRRGYLHALYRVLANSALDRPDVIPNAP